VLGYECLRRREQDVRVVVSTAVAVSTSALLTLQVGVFASRYVGQLAERYLIVAAPPLFACFVVWLARGLPRPQPATAVIALTVAVPALLLPLRQLVTPYAAPDAFMTIPLRRLQEATSWGTTVAAWTLAAALLVGLAVVVPRRAGAVLALLVGAVLAVSAVVASVEVSRLTRHDRAAFFAGSSPAWVDAASDAPVVELYAGSSYWNAVWSTAFWNERLTRVVQLPGTPFSGVSVPVVQARPDGTLVEAGRGVLRARYIVAPPTIAFSGAPVAQAAAQGLDIAGQRLWRTDGTVKLTQLTVGIQPNGDLTAPVDVFVYDCSNGHGRLELTLLGKMPATVEIRRSGLRVMQFAVAPDSVWRGSVAAPSEAHGGVCSYEILASALVGSTQIEFVRD
jgi:hypothetical protein